MDEYSYIVEALHAGERLDKFISEKHELLSRSHVQKLIQEQQITVNHKIEKANYRLKEKDKILLHLPEPKTMEILPENIPLDILYEDDDIIVINKGKNMVVHPAPGHYSHTVVNALLYHCKDSLSGINGILRPGIVHRIDKDTTGAIVICKNDFSHACIAGQLKEHSIHREYRAIVHNAFSKEEGSIDAAIGRNPKDRKKMAVGVAGGREAVTHYHVLDALNHRFSYIACQLETGRTHQIRVHMASIGHPVLGDAVYGPSKCPFHLEGQTLHAGFLGFIHPTSKKYMEFEAPLPEYFTRLLQILGASNI